MSKIKTCNKSVFVAFCALGLSAIFSVIINNSAFAASAGVITDANDTKWEYIVEDPDADRPQQLIIKFFDKAPSATTVTVPSFEAVKSLVTAAGATLDANLDTYYLKNGNRQYQQNTYPSVIYREPTATTTKLDMSNTSKIQILGVKPIIDPEVETELVFGPNMVIGNDIGLNIWAPDCVASLQGNEWYCPNNGPGRWMENMEVNIPGWEEKTNAEKEAFTLTREEAIAVTGCIVTQVNWIRNDSSYGSDPCFITSRDTRDFQFATGLTSGSAFGGYKLKLTNFSEENFNYIGWNAFKDSTLNAANTSISISSDVFGGSYIFRNTNVENITINTNNTGAGLFKDCTNIQSVSYGDNANSVAPDTFAGTNLTSFDFGANGIKNIGARSFEGARIEEVNFTGVERIDYRAFKDNDITELYLPKSINKLGAEVFKHNGNMKKVTIAYDTMTSGTVIPLHVVLDNAWYKTDGEPSTTIEEVNVIAPYAADEEVSATHISMYDYTRQYDDYGNYHEEKNPNRWSAWKNTCGMGYTSGNANYWSYIYEDMCDAMYEPEARWAKPDEKKNVIAPRYFHGLYGLKKIIVGDGYEYIGGSAFSLANSQEGWSAAAADVFNGCSRTDIDCSRTSDRRIQLISLPESLKGIGALAFGAAWYPGMEVNIPRNIEFIGSAAFKKMFTLEIDVDFPNLKYLGDDAFAGTLVRNIYLHDKLEYMGWAVFHSCYGIRDITFDIDVYNPDNLIIWGQARLEDAMWSKTCHTYSNGDEQCYISTPADNGYGAEFRGVFGGLYYDDYVSSANARAEWGFEIDENLTLWRQKFRTITFTEKAVTAPRVLTSYEYGYTGNEASYGIVNPENPRLPTSTSGSVFNYMAADKFDISATPWKILRPYAFNHSVIGKLLLPENLEVIGTGAFSQAKIYEELVLPDTLKMIGDGAFDNGQSIRVDELTPKITKLPESLEFIGAHAFWGDYNLTADAYLPNLKRLYGEAFTKTRIRDVYLPDTLEWLSPGTFNEISTLRDITIDADLGRLITAKQTRPITYQHFPQSLISYSGDLAAHYIVSIELLYNQGFSPDSSFFLRPTATFYSIFNQRYISGNGCDWDAGTCNNPTQGISGDTYGSLVFTDKNTTNIDANTGFFSGLTFGTVDMGAAGWTNIAEDAFAFSQAHIGTLILPDGLKTVNEGAFHDAVIENEFSIPSSTKTIERAAFQNATGTIVNSFAEGLKDIQEAAFYNTDMADDIVIPSTVTHIGKSAFNAGSEDVHYDTFTIRPALTFEETDDQLVHQFMWNSSVDKLIIESPTLPALDYGINGAGDEEFWNMDMNEVVLKNLTGISYAAFDGCTNLTKVDATGDPDLAVIGEEAFIRAEKLDTFLFAEGSKDKVISVGPNAFEGTGFTELGGAGSKFDLTAAKFDASAGHSFANMPKLKKVTVPRNFSGATIPEYTFYNNTLLEEAQVDYKITDIKNAAFALDNNLKRIFIWGDTIVQDDSLDGYAQPTRGRTRAVVGPTIPEATDIYAYSTSKTEAYAASPERSDFNGTFYPLDEVLYLTSNHPTVLLNEDDTDFDKSNLVVYAMRRDGIVLESDSWQEFDGNAYARAGKGLSFEHMAETIAENEAFGTVWDTPVPVSELDLSNQNFANLAYLIRPADDDPAVLTVDLKHTDAYTAYLANTNVDPRDYVPEPIPDEPDEPTPDEPIPAPTPDTPKTGDEIVKFVTVLSGAVAAAGTLFFIVKRRR